MIKKDQVDEISNRSSGEALIESQLDNIRKKWAELSFQVVTHADYDDKFKIS